MSEHETGKVVQGIHTMTSVFVAPDGSKHPYFSMECYLPDNSTVRLEFNLHLTIGILHDMTRMLLVANGIPVPGTFEPPSFDTVPDFDNMPAPPQDPQDGPEGPDRNEDV